MKSFKTSTSPRAKEIDLRSELNKFFFGASDEVAKGCFFILRRMRRQEGVIYPTTSSELQTCICKSSNHSGEVDKDYPCQSCEGEGYLFDDEIVVGYKTSRFEYQAVEKYTTWGKNIVELSFFYIEHHEAISRYDKLIEPLTNSEGEIISPVKILHKHNIHMAERFRDDCGRLSYFRISCFTD